jgi:hypothetical protein
MPLSVDATAYSNLNILTTSITLCSTTTPTICQIIDHVLVDTGSVGLRVFASALKSTLNLTQQVSTTSNGNPVVECYPFASGYTWGSVKFANVQLGGETVTNLAIQVMGDPLYSTVPTSCSSFGTSINTAAQVFANGILGVGLFKQDCQDFCIGASSLANIYYSCNMTSCTNIPQNIPEQLQNPVSLFTKDNNGVIIQLNPIYTPKTGQLIATGTMIFGVDTENNNVSTNTTTLTTNSAGMISTQYQGQTFTNSFLDTGSNVTMFTDNTITSCPTSGALAMPGFYCPPTQLLLTATSSGLNNSSSHTINFSVDNAASMVYNSPFNYAAFTNIAAPAWTTTTFDWGLPFYYGNSVYTVIEGNTTTKGSGPYFGW